MSLLSTLNELKARIVGDSADENLDHTRGSTAASEALAALPMMLGTALLSATIVLVFLHFTSFGMPRTVTFDIIKYVNAQRAIASKFMGGAGTDTEDATTQLLSVSKHTREAIREAAGTNTVVVISQSIVSGNTRDITDEVLTKLGLPTNVPTTDPSRRAIDIAPTVLGDGPRFSPGAPIQADPSKSSQSSNLP